MSCNLWFQIMIGYFLGRVVFSLVDGLIHGVGSARGWW